MNVTGPIKTLIAADTTANGVFSGRVYPGVLPQQTAYPSAALNVVGMDAKNSKTTASTLDIITLQVDVYAETYTAAADAAAAIRGAIDFHTSGSLNHIQFENQLDMFSAKPELNRITQTYSIGFSA